MKVSKSLIFLIMLAVAGCGSSQETAADFVSSGDKLAAKGEVEKARIEYKNAIQIDPRMADPYYKLALLDEKAQKWKSMFSNLAVVEQLAPNHIGAMVKLGRLYALGGQYDEAMSRADKALGLEPDNTEAMILKASIFTKQEKYDDATAALTKVLKQDPDNLEALTMQIIIARNKGKYQDALTQLDNALHKHPKEVSLLLIELSILEKQKDYAAMKNVYQQIIEQKPDNRSIVVSYSQLLNNALGQHDEAVKTLEKFIADNPADTEAKQMLVALDKSTDADKALARLESYIQAEPQNYDLRFTKVTILLEQKKNQLAQKELESIITDDPEGISGNKARVTLATMAASEGDFEQAQNIVQQVLAVAPEDTEALLLRAKLQMRKGNTDQAITDLRTVLRNAPDSDKALVLLAQAYTKSGSTELAEDSFRQALTANPYNTVAALSVAQSLLKENNYDRTEEVLLNALKKHPDDSELLQALAQVRILKKDWVGGQKTVDLLKQSQTADSAFSHFLSAQLYQGQQDYTLAATEYKAALAINPKMSRALQGLEFSMEKQGQKQELVQYLTEFNQQHPDLMDGYAVLAVFYLRDKQEDKAATLLTTQLDKHKDWAAGYNLLGDYYLESKQVDKAIAIYEKGSLQLPDNNQIALKLAYAYETVKDYSKAKSLYEQVLARDNSVDVAANNLASILTDPMESEANLKQALELAKRFKESTNPYLLDTYAWVNTKLGNFKEAEPIMVRVVTLAGNVPIFSYHLGVLYSKSGKKDEARQYLDKAKQLATTQEDTALLKQIEEALTGL